MKTVVKFLLGSLLIFGVQITAISQQFVNYTNGKNVRTIVENNQGIWIATTGGLVKYQSDFSEYQVYTRTNSTLPSNFAWDLCKGTGNELWGIFRYPYPLGHYDGQSWEVIPTDILPENIKSMLINANCITLDSAGVVWIGTSMGILRYDENGFTVYDESNTQIPNFIVYDIEVDPSNRIIAGCYRGLAIFDGEFWEYFSKDNSAYPFQYGINCLKIAGDGKIWFTSFLEGICCYNGQSYTVYDTTNSPLPGIYTYKIALDQSGAVWITCYENSEINIKGGLVRFDGVSWQVYDQSNTPFLHSKFSTLGCLNDGSILANNDSLYRFSSQNWQYLNTSNSWLPGNVMNQLMMVPGNDLWVCNYSDGISKINGYSWQNFYQSNSAIPCNYFSTSSFGPDSSAYFFFEGCFNVPNSKRFMKYKDAIWTPLIYDTLNYYMLDMVCAQNGELWWISYNSPGISLVNDSCGILTEINLTNTSTFHFVKTYIKNDSTAFIFGIDEAFLIKNGQISLFSGGTYPLGWVIDVKTGPDNKVYAIFEECAYRSLYCYDGINWSLAELPGFPGGSVSCFNWDQNGNLWIGHTSTGFSIFSGNTCTDFHIDTHPIPFGFYGFLEFDNQGNAWFGVQDAGLLVYNPNGVNLNIENLTNKTLGKISCYPNPSSGIFTIDLKDTMNLDALISVFNANGANVFQGKSKGRQLVSVDLSDYPRGLYLVRVSKNAEHQSFKIILK